MSYISDPHLLTALVVETTSMPFVNFEQVSRKAFDYVIVGEGASGLTLASRLSRDPALSVLVTNAGQTNLDNSIICGKRLCQTSPQQQQSHRTASSYS